MLLLASTCPPAAVQPWHAPKAPSSQLLGPQQTVPRAPEVSQPQPRARPLCRTAQVSIMRACVRVGMLSWCGKAQIGVRSMPVFGALFCAPPSVIVSITHNVFCRLLCLVAASINAVVMASYYPIAMDGTAVTAVRRCPQRFYCPGGQPLAAVDPASLATLDAAEPTIKACPDGTWTRALEAASVEECCELSLLALPGFNSWRLYLWLLLHPGCSACRLTCVPPTTSASCHHPARHFSTQ